MSNKKEIYLTEEGLEELKKELDFYKLEKRPEVIAALKDARAQGDLSENAEYDAARNEQAQIEAKIRDLEAMIESAVIIKCNWKSKILDSVEASIDTNCCNDSISKRYLSCKVLSLSF